MNSWLWDVGLGGIEVSCDGLDWVELGAVGLVVNG